MQTVIQRAVAFCRREGFDSPEVTEDSVDCDKHQLMFWVRFGEAEPREVVYIEMEHTL